MNNIRFWILVGLVVGAVWAFTDVGGALLTLGLGAVGFLVGYVIEQGIDLREVLKQDRDN
ncbi:hypothetical protein [Rhabdothermincola salaria]|uniref:hypothetical protein n=1 Tax=Rhabdothermincola salaria TaxID=2903142 RepID=UPI001E4958C4|nr:hypothetical protein [Rhabdothermincola salaria]MCD9623953.1 hypothetical protein [Rhabdothermincola salaria]